jgi:hypothetical protein
MPGPLSSLGQALALGIGDIAAERKDERLRSTARQQQLEDESRRRTYAKADIQESRLHEEALYEQRRFDAIKDDLIRSGLLKVEDRDKQDAISAALAKTSVEYRRAAEELANYKAALPKLIEAVGKIDGADKVMSMTAENVADARAVVQAAYAALGEKVEKERNLKEKNAKTAAALLAAELERKSNLQAQLKDIQDGVVSPEEQQQAFRQAAAKMGFTREDQIPADQRAAIQADADKVIKDGRMVKAYQLQNSLREVEKSFDNITDNVRAGVYGYLDDVKPSQPAPKAAAAAAVVTADDEAAALDALRGGKTAAPTPSPTALGDGYGGLMGAASAIKGSLPSISPMDGAKLISGAGLVEPVARGLNYLAGGSKRVAEGDAARAGGIIPKMGLSILGGDYEQWNADLDKSANEQIQVLQQQLNTIDPSSPAANQLRTKIRSLQFQLSKPVALGVD